MYTLHYHHLHLAGRGYAFPCNKDGELIFEEMCTTMMSSFVRVSSAVGVDYTYPEIVYVGAKPVLQ